MTYPSFPISTHHPVFLDVFDPSFMGGKFPVTPATDPPAFGVLVGGLSAIPAPTSGGHIITTNQWSPLCSAWADKALRPLYMPQIRGLAFSMVNLAGVDDGGQND